MGHALITGVTTSGKTTLAKHLASRLKRVAVYARYDSDWGVGKVFYTSSIKSISRFVETNINCNIFIDESGEAICRNDNAYQFLATRTRHFGNRVFFITQRYKQLTPNIRFNCDSLYIFRQNVADCEELAKINPVFFDANKLVKYHYYEMATPFSEVVEKVIPKFK